MSINGTRYSSGGKSRHSSALQEIWKCVFFAIFRPFFWVKNEGCFDLSSFTLQTLAEGRRLPGQNKKKGKCRNATTKGKMSIILWKLFAHTRFPIFSLHFHHLTISYLSTRRWREASDIGTGRVQIKKVQLLSSFFDVEEIDKKRFVENMAYDGLAVVFLGLWAMSPFDKGTL